MSKQENTRGNRRIREFVMDLRKFIKKLVDIWFFLWYKNQAL